MPGRDESVDGPQRHYLNAAVEHLRTLRDVAQDEIPDGGNLLWNVWLRDARGATATGRKIFLDSTDIADFVPLAAHLRGAGSAQSSGAIPVADAACALHLQILDAMRTYSLQISGRAPVPTYTFPLDTS